MGSRLGERRWPGLAWPLAFLFALTFRFAIVHSFHTPGGDGLFYFKLSQQLRAHGRLAVSPTAAPTYSRLPGYPLFLAFVAVRSSMTDLGTHVRRATRANVVLDLATASLVAVMLLRLRRRLGTAYGAGVALIGFLAIVCAPPMWILASYAMTEPLATFLLTCELALALALMEGAHLRTTAVLTGLVAGLAQLVRGDAVTFAPAVLIALLAAPVGWKQRATAAALVCLVGAAVFLPWPLRNLHAFGAPHPFAAYWRTVADGRPLPIGPIAWARTWASGEPGESYFDYAIANEVQLDPDRPGIMMGPMFDDDAEAARVRAIFTTFNTSGLSPPVDEAFRVLAAERAARNPYRTYVTLPLRRLRHLWEPVQSWELPMTVPWLKVDRDRRALCLSWDLVVYAAALLGLVSLAWSSSTRALAAMLLAPIVVRSLLLVFTVAVGATERHLVELHPLLVVLAMIGVVQRGRPVT